MKSTRAGLAAADAEGLLSSLRRLHAHLPPRRRLQLLLILALMLAGAAAELATIGAVLPFLVLVAQPEAVERLPVLGKLFGAIGVPPGRFLTFAALVFVGVAIGAAAVRLLLTWTSQKFAFRLGHEIGCAVYERTLHRPYADHLGRNSSTVMAGINKVQSVVGGVLMPLLQGVSSALMAVFIVVGLFAIDPLTAIAAAAGIGAIYVGVSLATRRRLKANSRIIAATQTERIRTLQEGIGGIRDVILDAAQDIYVAKFVRFDAALRDTQAANAFIAAAPRFVIEAAGMVLIALLALALARRTNGIAEALPVLGALALGAQRLLPLLQGVYGGWTQIAGNRHNLLDVLEALGPPAPALRLQARAPASPLPFARSISFERVGFRYAEGDPMVLSDISFVVPKGVRVGIVGQTGRGKSTLMDLAMGLLLPTAGVIRVDGEPLTASNMGRWQARIAHVPQAIYLADTSIAENIAFGAEPGAIDMARVKDAARQAAIADFVEGLPDAYATRVGERGVRLSGGQRQRIGIARALYREADVLVLDEATNALDEETEALLFRTISALKRERTIFLIAHRLPPDAADLVLSLDTGHLMGAAMEADPATAVSGRS